MALQNDIPSVKKGDWNRLKITINKLKHLAMGADSHPAYAGLTLTDLTASRLVASDAGKGLESTDLNSWVTGTANQITITDDADGTITLSTPQDIHTGATNFTVAGASILPASSTTNALTIKVSGDAAARLQIRADGLIEWGDGTNAVDTNLYRSAANYIKTDDTFEADVVYGTSGVAVKNANRLYMFTDNTSYYNSFQSPTGMSATITYTLPSADGAANEVLQTDGSANLSWVALGTAAGGSDTQVQYNDSGVLAGNANFTIDKTYFRISLSQNLLMKSGKSILFYDDDNSNTIGLTAPSDVTSNVTYTLPEDGTSGQILQTNGSGVLSWAANASVPAGNNYEIQYNANGSLGADEDFKFYYDSSPQEIYCNVRFRITSSKAVRFQGTGSSNYIELIPPSPVGTSVTYTLPEDGSNTECLITNGSGTLSWATHDGLSGFVANEHIDHTSVTITTGIGMTGGGDISANRTFDVDVGIADDKIMQVDDADAADDDYAKFTANGLEGRSYSEVLSDLSGQAGAAFAWNSQNLTGVGTIGCGVVTGTSTAAFEGASVTVGKASTTTGTIVLHDSNSANTITLTVPDISAGSLSFTLPPTDGDNTNVLQTNGSGVLTWAAASGSGFTSKCSVKLSAVQSVATATQTKVEFDSEDYDIGNEWDSATNYRFTATATGYYAVSCAVSFNALDDQDVCIVIIKVNGTNVAQVNVYASKDAGSPGIGYSKDLYLAASDYVDFHSYHDYGANRNLNDTIFTYATIHRFG